MNSKDVQARLEVLSTRWCTLDLVQELLGLDLAIDDPLVGALRTWGERFRGRSDVERSAGGQRQIDRHILESFLLQNGWISWKWAAVHLGLDSETLRLVVDRLRGAGAFPQLESGVSGQLIRQREAATLYRQFPSMRMRSFSSPGTTGAMSPSVRTDGLALWQRSTKVTQGSWKPTLISWRTSSS